MKFWEYIDQVAGRLGMSNRKSVHMTAGDQRKTDNYTFSFRMAKTVLFPYEAIQKEIALNPWCSPSRSPGFNVHDIDDGILAEVSVWMLTVSKSAQLERKLQKIIDSASKKT